MGRLRLDTAHRNSMAASRLTESQKGDLLTAFRNGATAVNLAKVYACSPNTVIRTIKTLISADEYAALKASRSRVGAGTQALNKVEAIEEGLSPIDGKTLKESSSTNPINTSEECLELDTDVVEGPLALDDADDFGEEQEEEPSQEIDAFTDSESRFESFQEIVPLNLGFAIDEKEYPASQPLSQGVLPNSVYILVDKSVELDVRPLSDFPELDRIDESEKVLKAISLFVSPRTAKRQCGRNQRVIKIPDTSIFEITARHLISRGITRLILEGAIISLDN